MNQTPKTVTADPLLPLHPIDLGPVTLPNRLAVAPMTRVSADPDGVPTPAMADYYAEFARGGFGLIISEGIHPDATHSQGYRNQPGLADDSQVAGWRNVAASVREQQTGAVFVAQLMHAGATAQYNRAGHQTVAPSAVAPKGQMMEDYGGQGPFPLPAALDSDGIAAVVSGFVDAAERAREAGFAGVELHAANGYLLDQFITDYTNVRTDEYGGSPANRARLTADIAHQIRHRQGPDFVIGIRVSQIKPNDRHHRWAGAAEAEAIFATLGAADPDYLHVASEGGSWAETATMDDGRTITQIARQTTGLPVIANGGLHDRTLASTLLADGHADIVSVGRWALANPDLPQRWAAGRDLVDFDAAIVHPDPSLKLPAGS